MNSSSCKIGTCLLLSAFVVSGCSEDTSTNAGADALAVNRDSSQADSVPDVTAVDLSFTTTVLAYDDGTMEGANSPWDTIANGVIGTIFTPPAYPCHIKSVRFFVASIGKPATEFKVRIMSAVSTTDPPGQDLLTAHVTATADEAGDQWVDVDLSEHDLTVTSGLFFVGMDWLTAPGTDGSEAQFLGMDGSDPDKRSWWGANTGWGTFADKWMPIAVVGNEGDRDAMIRVVVTSPRP